MTIDEVAGVDRERTLRSISGALALLLGLAMGDDVDTAGAPQVDAGGERMRLGDCQRLPNHRGVAGFPVRWIERAERQIAGLAARSTNRIEKDFAPDG